MKKNRKKADTYRFNGVWGMNPINITQLESLIEIFEAKLSDPNDPDDKKWTERWLQRFQRELTKKRISLEWKQAVVGKDRRHSKSVPPDEGPSTGVLGDS